MNDICPICKGGFTGLLIADLAFDGQRVHPVCLNRFKSDEECRDFILKKGLEEQSDIHKCFICEREINYPQDCIKDSIHEFHKTCLKNVKDLFDPKHVKFEVKKELIMRLVNILMEN